MPPDAASQPACAQALLVARERVLAAAPSDTRELLPAWRRYQGRFYRSAGARARRGRAVGSCGDHQRRYGVAAAGELIGWYDKVLRLSD